MLFAALLLLICFAQFGFRTTQVEDLRRLTEQNLAIGASPEKVLHFLDAYHLEHSELMRPEAMRLGDHDYANRNIIAAIKRRTKIGLISREDIQLVFIFDEGHRLAKIDLVPVYTSL